ncbi:MAG: flavodoxin family protein [Bacteroidales bacterium]|nr:flavodoxin family protein [Bacteroidales bacterium]
MKILVTYWSQTGNTKKVAEAIFNALPETKFLKPFNEVQSLEGYDLIFIGFPVMQFGPHPEAKKFLSGHAVGRKIALFVTHAMLSGGENPKQEIMLKRELDKCRAACSGSELLGLFHCQGELSENAANELMASNIPMLMEFAKMLPLTIGHPDQSDLDKAKVFTGTVITAFLTHG